MHRRSATTGRQLSAHVLHGLCNHPGPASAAVAAPRLMSFLDRDGGDDHGDERVGPRPAEQAVEQQPPSRTPDRDQRRPLRRSHNHFSARNSKILFSMIAPPRAGQAATIPNACPPAPTTRPPTATIRPATQPERSPR